KKIKIPGLGTSELLKVKTFLYGEVSSAFSQLFRPHRIMLLRRFFILLIPLILSYLLFFWKEYMSFNLWIVLAIGYLVFGILYQILRYKSLELIFTEEFLQK